MRVLVVVGSNLKINTSANLCHKAYIQGLLEKRLNYLPIHILRCVLAFLTNWIHMPK